MKKRMFAILLSAIMIFAVAGCGNSSKDSSSDVISNTVNSSDSTDSIDSTDSTNNNSTSSAEPTSAESADAAIKNNKNIDLNKLKGTTVKVLMWRSLTDQEKATIESFKNKYGITVKIEEAPLNSSEYMTKLSSLIASGDAPDIGVQSSFPLGSASAFQPVDVTKQDFSDPVWDTDLMAKYKLKGYNYVFIANGNWYDNYGIVVFNEDMFTKDGIKTPYQLWKEGNWNWDTLKSTAAELKKKGHKYGYITHVADNLMLSANSGIVTYDGTSFKNSLTDKNTIKAWTFHTQMVEEGLQPTGQDYSFNKGETGMMGINSWVMLKGQYLRDCTFKWMCVPFPSPKGEQETVPLYSNLFGVVKGAKNPVGAGVFLRYFLDPANNGNFADRAIDSRFEEVFNYMNQKSVKKCVSYVDGVIGFTNASAQTTMYSELQSATSAQVSTVLQKYRSVIENGVNNVNKRIK